MAACGNDNFPEQSKLGDLRVLAISADTPEINSATTVTLTPLISFVNGGNTTLNFTWEACPDPGIDFGAEVNCNKSLSTLKQTGSGSFNTNTLAGSYYTGLTSTISLTINSAIFTYLSSLDSSLQFNGVDYLFIITYTDSTTQKNVQALRRIKLSTKASGDLNTNPSFGGILFNNSTLSAYPSSEGDFLLSGTSSAQTYSKMTNIGSKTFSENMFISWYSSTGEFLYNRTDIGEKNTFTPSGTTGVFVAVYRDGRGGVFSRIESF